MIPSRFSSAESRLLHLTLEEINKQRLAAGASALNPASPVGTSQRSAQANYTTSNAPKGQTALAVTDPKAASAARLKETQTYIQENPEAFRSVQNQTFVDPVTGETSVTGKVVDNSQDILAQAAQGAEMAGTYKVSADQLQRAAGNAEDLAGAAGFKAQEAALGPKAGAMGQAGALGYNPQGSLATLQGLKQKAAQYSAPSVTIDPASASYLTTEQKQAIQDRYTAEKLTAEANLKAFQDKMAKDQQVKTSTQQFSAGQKTTTETGTSGTTVKGPDFTMMDQGLNQISAMITADPTLAATYVPQMMDLMARRTKLENDYNAEISAFNAQDKNNDGVSDGVSAQVASSQAAILARTAKADAINEENKNINLAAAELAKDMGQIAQKKFQLDQHRNEQLQIQNNIEMERKNRLIANKLGVATGGNGMRWMSEEIQKGLENLTYLREAGSLQEANFALQIGQQYSLNVRQAVNGYDAQKLQIDADFASNMANLNSIVTLDAKERRAEKKSITKDYLEALDKNDTKLADMIKDFNKTVSDNIKEYAKNKQKDAMSTKDKLGFTSSLRSGINQNKVITQAKDVDGFYGALNAGFNEYASLIKQIESGEVKAGDISLNPSQSAVIGSLARILDPGSVVRNEEYERQVLGQSAPNMISGWLQKIRAGGTGLTTQDVIAMKNLADGLHDSWEEKLSKEMQPFILDIQDWNASYPDAQIRYDQVIPVDRVHLPSQTMSTWESQANDGSIPVSRSDLNANSSLYDFFSVYAPSSDNNSPTSYAAAVAKDLGVTPDTPIGELKDNLDAFAKAIAKHEGFISGDSRLAVENNNPGNLKFIGQAGATMGRKGFAKFESVEAGYAALKRDILAKIGDGSSENYAGTGTKTYSLVPSAQAESPDDVVIIKDYEPEESPLVAGSAFNVKGQTTNPELSYKILGKFKNTKTGEVIRPTSQKDIEFYRSRPTAYEDLEAVKPKTNSKSLSLGGKSLPS